MGIGLHSGRPARLCLKPAAAGHGIVFLRSDMADDAIDAHVPARFDLVSDTRLNTRLENADGVSVSTVEHLMAALAGCGVHNVRVEIDGPEVPIFDGSSHPFVRAIMAAGIVSQNAPLRIMRMVKPVEITRGDATAALVPHDDCAMDFGIAFSDAAIGTQSLSLDLSNGTFLRELADCRTFCRQRDVAFMQSCGLALGGTYDNAVVVDGADVLSPGGFRRSDECVRHKMLDALGDLALSGMPFLGRFVCDKGGHAVTNLLLRAVMADPTSFEIVEADAETAGKLPGMKLTAQDYAAVV